MKLRSEHAIILVITVFLGLIVLLATSILRKEKAHYANTEMTVEISYMHKSGKDTFVVRGTPLYLSRSGCLSGRDSIIACGISFYRILSKKE